MPQHRTSYDFAYEYGSSRPHAPTHVGGRRFQYDLNGNQLGWDDDRSGRRRTILWDAEDRPQSISDNSRRRGPRALPHFVQQLYILPRILCCFAHLALARNNPEMCSRDGFDPRLPRIRPAAEKAELGDA
ncbi:MAG: hypothetical protein DRJ42_09710 [Deltaproteobacteria bacterium]|nr:MAG: hypothetical protein DRJ42_09710 [Deltaproteobacteria bacterium]